MSQPGKVSHPKKLSYRWRLALAFGLVAFGAGLFALGSVYAFMRFVPTYSLADSSGPAQSAEPSVSLEPSPAGPPAGQEDSVPSGPAGTGTDTPGGDSGVEAPGGGSGTSALEESVASAFPITDAASMLNTLLIGGGIVLLALTALSAWIGWITSGRMLKPLAQIGAAAHRIGGGDLSHRIALEGPRDEIGQLADTFDHTFDRLERAFAAQGRFAANAAHELRTPLAATKTVLDVARAHPKAVDHELLLDQIGQNNDRSIQLVQALLQLTELDAVQIERSESDLSQLVHQILPGIDTSEVEVQLDLAPAPALVDHELMALAVSNLVRNAIQHNNAKRFVSVATSVEAGVAVLAVENSGPVVSADEIPRLTEPLYRSQRTAGGGHGLGLAIVQSIVDLHNGDLKFEPRPSGGLLVHIRLPRPAH